MGFVRVFPLISKILVCVFVGEWITANEGLEKLASYGLLPNMILYLMEDYHIGVIEGTNILFFWSAATNFFPLFGAFISDSYLGRFLTIGLGSIFSLLVIAFSLLLWSNFQDVVLENSMIEGYQNLFEQTFLFALDVINLFHGRFVLW